MKHCKYCMTKNNIWLIKGFDGTYLLKCENCILHPHMVSGNSIDETYANWDRENSRKGNSG